MPRFALAITALAIAGGAVWIERDHRVVIDAPAAADFASLAAAAGCPENDTMPYGEDCAAFLQIPAAFAPRMQMVATLAQPGPCPDTDKVPYSASCIAFLKGATETGMRWRAIEAVPSVPVSE